MRAVSQRRLILGAAALLLAGVVQIQAVMNEPPGKPVCHKAVNFALLSWQDQNATSGYPNVAGRSTDSLARCDKLLHNDKLSGKYKYVPGLTRDDPGELVLLYMAKPTRWTWHGERPSKTAPLKWLVVPVDFRTSSRKFNGNGEQSEQLTEDQFFTRLEGTLRFIEANERPNWESIVKEHRAFLETVRKQQGPS